MNMQNRQNGTCSVGDNIIERQFPSQFSSSSIQAQSAQYKHCCLVGSVSAVTFLILAVWPSPAPLELVSANYAPHSKKIQI